MDYTRFLQDYKDGISNGSIQTLEPLLSLFTLSDTPLSLVGREPMKPLFKLHRPKRMTLLAGRQVSKSYTVAELAIMLSGFNKDFTSVVVEPYFEQKKRFTRQILSPLLRNCFVQDLIVDKSQIDPMDIKQMKAGGQIILVNGVKTASGSRGVSGVGLVTIDELQDVLNQLVPIFEAVADAKTETGFRMYSGTAKMSDDALALRFNASSQGHWCVKCSCGKYNIASIDEQLVKMLQPKGCSCAFCGKLLNVASGYFVHKYPSRVFTNVGYHLPQPIMPFHNTEGAWTELMYKMGSLSKTAFYNEVLGCFDDESVRMLTKEHLIDARNEIRSLQQAINLADQYEIKIMGVDWGGGGGGDSATGIAVLGKRAGVERFDCIYLKRLPQGHSAEEEARAIGRLANEFRVDFIAHDYTGAGFVREALFLTLNPEWKGRMYPISYSYRPTSDLISYSESGSRASYVVDKTKSLLLTINCIKYRALSLPWFDPRDDSAPQYDFLAIIEHGQSVGPDSMETKNTVQRASTIYLLDKVAGKKDDAAQAINVGLMALCNLLHYFPVFTIDDRFNMTDELYAILFNDDSPNPI